MFPPNYLAFRNDRGSLGGGVFVLVNQDIIAVEQPQYVTSCEIVWVKIQLRGNKDLYVGSFYMPHRNIDTVRELEKSLELLDEKNDRHIVLCGDFNCPDVNWPTYTVNSKCQDSQIQQNLADVASSYNLTQVHESPTREDNLLDLIFTSVPSLIKSSVNTPGISDHDIVVTDSITKPKCMYNKQKARNFTSSLKRIGN